MSVTKDRYCMLCRSAWAHGAPTLPPVDPEHGLCQRCADAFQDLADALDPNQPAVYLHAVDVEAVLEAVRAGRMADVTTADLADVLTSALLTSEEDLLLRGELGRRA